MVFFFFNFSVSFFIWYLESTSYYVWWYLVCHPNFFSVKSVTPTFFLSISQLKVAILFDFPSALDKIITQGYKALQLEYYFTCGPDEVKAWTIQKGTKAPQAAGKIHTDFERGFVMAEVMKFSEFKEEGSEAACKVRTLLKKKWKMFIFKHFFIHFIYFIFLHFFNFFLTFFQTFFFIFKDFFHFKHFFQTWPKLWSS